MDFTDFVILWIFVVEYFQEFDIVHVDCAVAFRKRLIL